MTRFPRRLTACLARADHRRYRSPRIRARSRGEDGFVLLESVVSIAIVTIVMAALAALFVTTSKTTNHLRTRQIAIQLADSGIERVRAYAPNVLATDRDAKSVSNQYNAGIASTAPPALAEILGTITTVSDHSAADDTGSATHPGSVGAVCPTTSATSAYLPTAPECQAVGKQPFWVSYYLGTCDVPTDAAIGTACGVSWPSGTSVLTYLRAVVAVTWTNPDTAPCSNSSCSYVTSTLLNDSPNPRFDIIHAGSNAPAIVAHDPTSNVGDTIPDPFPDAPTLQAGTGAAPFTWAATGLPTGLRMAANGTISGTVRDFFYPAKPASSHSYPVSVTVVDGLIQRSSASFTWTVVRPGITTPDRQTTVIGTPVTLHGDATCAKTPCTYALTSGPPGLRINPDPTTPGALITGTPTTVGTFWPTVSITDANGVTATSDQFEWDVLPTPASVCEPAYALTNGSFENPTVYHGAPNWMHTANPASDLAPPANPPGWDTTKLLWGTTEPDHVVELWKNDGSGSQSSQTAQSANGGRVIPAQDGTQWAELNANQTGALYQDLIVTPGTTLQWSVWHRGRYSAAGAGKNDVMQVQIGSTTSQTPQVPTGKASANISDPSDDNTWHLYRGLYVIPAGQTTTRFQFAAVSTASGDNSIGNFIDNLSLNNYVACMQNLPDPQTNTVATSIPDMQMSATRGSGTFQWGGANTLPAGLSMTSGGLITGTPTTVGTYAVRLTLTDTQTTYTTMVPFTWTVVEKPTITAPINQTTSSGGIVNLPVVSTCPNRPCSYAINGPAGLTVSDSGVIKGTITSSPQTFSNVTVSVRDRASVTAVSAPFTWTVTSAPAITSPGDQKTLRGAAVSVDMKPRASGGRPAYTYTATNLPTWLTIDPASGVISGVAPASADSTTTGITVTLTDSTNATSTTAPFNWTVYSAPTVAAPANQASAIGSAVNLAVAYTCPNTPCTFTMTGQPTDVTIDNTGHINGTVSGPPQTYSNVRVIITDAGGASTRSSAFTWTISYPPLLPITPVDQVSTINTAIIPLQLTAKGSGSFSWAGNPPTGLTMTMAGRITGTPTTLGSSPVTLTVTDTIQGGSLPITFNWSVVAIPTVNAPADRTSTLGTAVNLPLTSTCPNAPCTYAVVNGPPGLTIDGSGLLTGTIGGSATTYNAVRITATDKVGATGTSAAFTWTVLGRPTITPANQITTIGASPIVTVPSTCPNLPCSYTMTGAPPGFSIGSGGIITGTVGGSPTTYNNVVVTITDAASVSVPSAAFTWTVKAKPTVTPANQTTTLGATVSVTVPSTCPNTPCTFAMTGAPPGLSINSSGIITGTVGGTASTYNNVVVTITDAASVSVPSAAFTWTVKAIPTITAPANQTTTVGATISLQLTSTCPNSPCNYTLNNGPATLNISSSGLVTGTVTSAAQTFSSVTVTITDAASVSTQSPAFTWAVLGKPTVTPVNQITTIGASPIVTVPSTCPNLPCSYTMTGAPPGLSIGSGGIITGTVGGSATTYNNVVVTITDAASVSVPSAAFTWTVKAKPTITTPANQTSTIGSTVSLNVASTCPNTPCTFAMTGAPPALSIDSSGSVAGTISGPPQTYSNVRVTITDAAGVGTQSSAFTWTISYPPLQAPTPTSQTSTINTAISSLQMTASGGSGSYRWTGTLPAGLGMTTGGLITGTPTTISSGSVTLTVTDTVTLGTLPITFNWAIVAKPTVAAPAAQTTTVGATISKQLTSTCPNSPCSYALNLGPATLSISSSGLITGTITSGAQTFSNVTVTITDAAGATANSAAFTWTVKAKPTINAPTNQTTTVGAAISLQLTSTCSNTPCRYTLNNGPATLSISSSGLITGTITSANQTFSNVTVTITDAAIVSTTSAAFTWTVNAAPTVANPGTQQTGVGQADSLDVSTLVSGGTGSFTYSASGLPNGLTINPSTGVIGGTAPTTKSITSGITVSAKDSVGVTGTSTAFKWIVTNLSVAIPSQATKVSTAVSLDLDNYVAGGTLPYVTITVTNKPSWLAYDITTHILSGTAPSTTSNSTGTTVTVTDTDGATVTSAAFNWRVISTTTTLNWSAIANRSSLPNVAATSLNAANSVSNETAGTFSATGLPPGLSITAAGVISGTPTLAGSYRVTVSANDSAGVSIPSAPFTWQVTDLALANIPNQTTAKKGAGSFDASTKVSGGSGPYTYTASGLPGWLSINASTGTISGDAPNGNSNTTGITVTVTDITGAVVTSNAFSWRVS